MKEGVGVGTVLDGRITLQWELVRTERFSVYRGYDARHQTIVGVTLCAEASHLMQYTEEALHLIRLSDFGSHSRRRIGGYSNRWKTCHIGSGSEHGLSYEAWKINPDLLEQPYRQGNFSTATKKMLLHAAGEQCQLCRSTHQLEVDHIVPVRFGGTAEPTNGMVLCTACHRAKTTVQFRCLDRSEWGVTPNRYGLEHLRGEPPYQLALPDEPVQAFLTKHDVWLHITTHASALLKLLPPIDPEEELKALTVLRKQKAAELKLSRRARGGRTKNNGKGNVDS